MYIGASALVQGLSLRDALDTLLEARSAAVIRRFFIFSFLFFFFWEGRSRYVTRILETRSAAVLRRFLDFFLFLRDALDT
jgi:hypothetical protein